MEEIAPNVGGTHMYYRAGTSRLTFVIVLLIGVVTTCIAEDAEKEAKPAVVPGEKWAVLFLSKTTKKKVVSLEKYRIRPVDELSFEGPKPGDEFLLGHFRIDGQWGLRAGAAQRISGRNTAIELARGRDFELEGIVRAEGLGGWFFLMGYENGNGYVLYNPTLKKSGSPWIICELRDGKAVEATHKELQRYQWKGSQPL